MPESLRIENLEKCFPGLERPALDTLSATIRPGKITGLAGPDGAGKTTLMRLMAGLLRPDKGSISVLGLDPLTDNAQLRTRLGYMPQKFGLYEDLQVMENLKLHAELRGLSAEEQENTFTRLLEFTDLKKFTTRLAGKLSGGMKQKLGLACALLGQPDVLLLDEPGVGVDPISRRELWKMVQDLAGQGLIVVWSTAYLEEAESCDTVFLLSEGRLLYEGHPAKLTEKLTGRCLHVRGIEQNRRRMLRQILNQPQVTDGVLEGRNLRVILKEDAARPDLNNAGEWQEAEPRFEDAFIDLLGGGPGGNSALAEAMLARPEIPGDLIKAEELTKKFGDFTATDHVNFTVRQGEIFGLLGPNGAGKSTTFKMMCGLLRPTSGAATVMGIDLARSAPKARERLGYMAQKFSLYGKLTTRQNLDFFSGAYGLSGKKQRQAVEKMIEAFHLQPTLKTRTADLALGYKQRLALACAAMHEPDILFLDEPTSGVDPITRREFWTHINALVEKGVTVMVTTHFMDEAEYCDRIGLVLRGQLIALASPDALKAEAASSEIPDPTMEDAFIALVEKNAQEQA